MSSLKGLLNARQVLTMLIVYIPLSTYIYIQLNFSMMMSENLRDLLEKLIQVDLSKRIGNLKNGAADIKDHVWFDTINWTALENREVSCHCTIATHKIVTISTEK